MENRDGPSPGGGGSMQGSLGFHLQRPIQPVNTGGGGGGGLHSPAPMRPTTTGISLASPSSDGPGSPHNLMNMNIGQAGTYSGGIGSPNAVRPDPLKRKRGRPRKYPGGDAGAALGTSLALTPVASSKDMTSPSSEKRGRGRPPGSGKKQQLAAFAASSNGAWLTGTAGSGFIPHVITIAAGEDVANKIFAFCQQGPRAVCVLSANGSISNVTLRHDSSYGGNITYEGRYEILSLSGSFLPTDVNGARSRTGGLSVSLAASDGKVVGGSVSGLLVAATPVQIVVGSFVVPDVKSRLPASPLGAGNGESMVSLMTTSIGLSPPTGTPGVTVAAVPLPAARPAKTETSGSKSSGQGGGTTTPSQQSINHQGGNGAPNTQLSSGGQFGGWQPPQSDSARRTSTDINISLPGG